LSLGLPGVEETISWGQPTLKAHGKLWVWWSQHEDAPVFKVPFEEREILVEAEPSTFFVTTHYKGHPLVSGRLGCAARQSRRTAKSGIKKNQWVRISIRNRRRTKTGGFAGFSLARTCARCKNSKSFAQIETLPMALCPCRAIWVHIALGRLMRR
jgi:hypothetical protein